MRGCEAIATELPGYVGGKLDMATAVAVEAHVRSCESCLAEVREIEHLEVLLSRALPDIELSAGFASRFANRLAAEMADEEQAREQPSWLSWLLQPWLVPLAAAAMLGAIVFAPWLTAGRAPKTEIPSLPSLSSGPGPLAKKPANPPAAANPAQPAPPAPPALAKKDPDLPKDLIQRPELFVDYAVIRDLDVLESGDAGAGKAG